MADLGELRTPVCAPIVGHLSLMASFAAVADVRTPGTLWVGALAYLLLQAGRALHEAASAWAGMRAGMTVRQVRLGVVFMRVDLASRERQAAHASAREHQAANASMRERQAANASARWRMALAGAVAQVLFGALLVAGGCLLQGSRVGEPVLLIGLVHLAAVSKLLLVPRLGFRVRVRPGKDLAPVPH